MASIIGPSAWLLARYPAAAAVTAAPPATNDATVRRPVRQDGGGSQRATVPAVLQYQRMQPGFKREKNQGQASREPFTFELRRQPIDRPSQEGGVQKHGQPQQRNVHAHRARQSPLHPER